MSMTLPTWKTFHHDFLPCPPTQFLQLRVLSAKVLTGSAMLGGHVRNCQALPNVLNAAGHRKKLYRSFTGFLLIPAQDES